MKRIILLITAITLFIGTADAQLFKKRDRNVETEYAEGMVPVTNGKVTFDEVIAVEGMEADEILAKAADWAKERYVEPTVISARRYDSGDSIIIRGEEYITFKSTFFVLSRARIYYYLTITAEDGLCRFNMTRITYWYDDEDDNGGIKMKAEEWITDDNAFNDKGGLKKFEGKFRRKTIDLKDALINKLTKKLNSK
jgi:hypothetical protein